MSPAPFQIAAVAPRSRAIDREHASLALFTAAWVTAYVGALSSPDHRLTLPWLACTAAAALGHGLLEMGSRRPLPRFLGVLAICSWLGWLFPVLGLRPLWPAVALSVAVTVGRALIRDPAAERPTIPAGAPAIESQGGRVRRLVVVGWLVAAGLITGLDGVAAAYDTLDTSGILLLMSGIGRTPSRKVRALLFIAAVLLATTIAGTSLAIAYGATRDLAAISKGAVVVLLGFGGACFTYWKDGQDPLADLRIRLLRAVSVTAIASGVAFYAIAPRGLTDQVTPELIAQYTPPRISWLLVGVLANVASLVVLLGLRSHRDWRWLRTRLRLDRLDWRATMSSLAIGALCLAVVLGVDDLLRDTVGAGPMRVFDSAVPWSVRLAMVALPAVWEELLFRGALQPRLGAVLSGGLFVAAHAGQYDALGVWCVALLAIVVIAVARRWGTLAAIVVHLTYNSGLLLFAFIRS